MNRIEELRAKLADGSITEEEKVELETLEKETEGAAPSAEDEEEAGKGLVALGKQLGQIALAEIKSGLAQDVKKAAVATADTKKEPELTGKERTKAFFVALFDNDHTKLDHLSGGTNGDGGFLVPQDYATDFVASRQDLTVMRRAGATVIQMVGNTFNIPNLATRPNAFWTNELAAKSSTSASWTNLTLTPYTLAAYMTASNQVIADAKIGGNLIDVITRLLTEAIAREEDKAFFVGSGTGQPTGLTTYTVTQVDAGGATDADDLVNAYYTLGQGYRDSAAWFMNSRQLRVVRTLKDSQGRYIFENAVNGSGFPTILGRPVFEQNNMASNEIWFGDPAAYWIGDREGISVRVSDEASVGGQSAFERNFTIIRVEERVDGELADTRGFVEIINANVS